MLRSRVVTTTILLPEVTFLKEIGEVKVICKDLSNMDNKLLLFIFKNLKKYQKGEFMPAAENGVLTGFDAFSNFLVYENYSDSSQDKINRFLLDREAVFFTMIDQYGSEKICYIIYVG